MESHKPPLFGASILVNTRPSSNRCGTPQSTPLRIPVSLLAHCLVSTPLRGLASSLAHYPKPCSDTICNGSNPPLADIVFFGLSLLGFLSRFLKTRLLGRVFHTLIKNVSFSSQPWDLTLNVGFFSFSSPLLQFLYVFSQKFGVTLVNR